jgi:hypothetical protein
MYKEDSTDTQDIIILDSGIEEAVIGLRGCCAHALAPLNY